MTPAQIEHGAELRELIHAQMYFIGIYATVVQSFAEACDDHGLDYALNKLAAYLKAALDLRLDIAALGKEAA